MAVFAAQLPTEAADAIAPSLGLPISCRLGENCWLVNLVDLDKSPGIRDYTCASHGYDGHKGTDIAIRDLAAMKAGVPVVAAAPGIVIAVREGMRDADVSLTGAHTVRRVECGNGVVLDHGGGWVTQYCHLRQGSVRVKKDAKVKRGRELGLVGLSGMTQFPHVHLSVRYKGRVVDPFVGMKRDADCGLGTAPLWRSSLLPLLKRPLTAVYHTGFAAKRPLSRAVRARLHSSGKALPRNAPALVLWADVFWPTAGDVLTMRIFSPDRELIHEHSAKIEKTQARRLFFSGPLKKTLYWAGGRYQGQIELIREAGGKQVMKISKESRIDIR